MTDLVLYRMVLANHICPSGLKLRHYLRSNGIDFKDEIMRTRDEVDAIKARFGSATTPILTENGAPIGGYEASRAHFGDPVYTGRTYRPVIAIFIAAALLALATSWLVHGGLSTQILPWFIALAMVLLGVQKLRDIESFASMFLLYDLLAQRYVPYARAYPFLETGAGVLMFAGVLGWLAAPIMLVASAIGMVSVIKAVWIDKRDLRCACTGGSTNVPLGPVSLLENVMMFGMSAWMLL